MKKVVIHDEEGNKIQGFIPETTDDLQKQITKNKLQNFREHLYMAFLALGILSFSIGIYISVKRLNGK